ncbi:MAG TPA: SusC/RagA family TonB-linked outer membrane protein, partial [Paludibacteraceae bacterium]|nr:SusC/RagA family TonB-linked outer membrane protein [Paludibacteraceae bacterium]
VVAYGTAKKSSFTGSAATVDAKKLSQRSVSNITNALAGQAAGVQVTSSNGQPGTAATIRIRGIGSMSASNAPLYVIDGVPYDGSLSAINPRDIENMTVLKDAAANAIYGARGANGVVLITTKKATTRDAVITVDAKWGTNSRGVPNYDVMKDPAMYYETFYKALYNSKANGGSTATDAYKYADANLYAKSGLGYLVYDIPAGEKLIGTNFKLNPNAKLGYSDGDYYYTPDNWYNELFDKGNMRQEYNVSIAGSSDKINFYMSAGYLDDSGIVAGSGFNRYSGRAKVDYNAKKWLKVGANVAYTNYDMQAPGSQNSWGSSANLFYVSNMIAPIYPMYVRNADGSIKVDHRGITVYDFGGSSTNFTRAFMPLANPGITLQLDKYHAYTDVVNSKWSAIITPLEGLQLTANLGANATNQRSNSLSNQFYGGSVGSEGFVTVSHSRQIGINQQYLANYKKLFGNVHNLELLAGYESYALTMQNLSGANSKLYDPYIGELDNAIQTPPQVSSNTDRYVTEGYLSRVQYDYDGKYFISASYRRDASSRFAPENRWGDFGSIGASWLMSKENFLIGSKWIDMLKFKASYGIQGNDNIGNYYAYIDQFTVSNSNNNYSVSFLNKGNRDITWETSYAFNTGFDFELFNRRLTGTAEYFSRKTTDLLYYKPVPISLGYSSIPTNVGSILNNGVELDLNAVIFRNKDIEWTANVNATSYKNKITDLSPDKRETGIKGSNYIYKIGGSLYNTYMRQYAGVDDATGKALYYLDPDNGDMTTTDVYADAKQSDLGSTLAKVYGGFGTQLNAYGFDFSILFSYQLGGKMYDGTYEALMHNGDGKGTNWSMDILNAWTPENPTSDIPRLNSLDVSYQYQSSRFMVSSDYLSLNSLILGYTIPKAITSKWQIASLRLYVSGDNLGLLSARQGLDPRQVLGLGSSTTSGNYSYSQLKTLSGGITLNF